MIACLVLFFHACTWEDQIFEGIKKIIPPDKTIAKPIYGCPICMTPWWGTIIYWLFIGESLKDWLITVGAAAGLGVVSVILLAIREACIIYIKQNEK